MRDVSGYVLLMWLAYSMTEVVMAGVEIFLVMRMLRGGEGQLRVRRSLCFVSAGSQSFNPYKIYDRVEKGHERTIVLRMDAVRELSNVAYLAPRRGVGEASSQRCASGEASQDHLAML
jgi:hypothetical protein